MRYLCKIIRSYAYDRLVISLSALVLAICFSIEFDWLNKISAPTLGLLSEHQEHLQVWTYQIRFAKPWLALLVGVAAGFPLALSIRWKLRKGMEDPESIERLSQWFLLPYHSKRELKVAREHWKPFGLSLAQRVKLVLSVVGAYTILASFFRFSVIVCALGSAIPQAITYPAHKKLCEELIARLRNVDVDDSWLEVEWQPIRKRKAVSLVVITVVFICVFALTIRFGKNLAEVSETLRELVNLSSEEL